jgi:hypothetical protein
MKKLIIAASMLLACTSFCMAQAIPSRSAKKMEVRKDSTVKHSVASQSKTSTTTTPTTTAHAKKDGTTDKRHKENKKPVKPVK